MDSTTAAGTVEDRNRICDSEPEPLIPIKAIEQCSFQYYHQNLWKFSKKCRSYAPSSEQPPAHPYFESVNPSEINELYLSLQGMVSNHLETVDNPDYELEALGRMTERLGAIKYGNNVTAVVMGAQGSGKSTLINSLLDSKDKICDARGGSRAVTTCPMSFQSSGWVPTSEEVIHRATIHFLSKQDIDAITTHYASYVDTYNSAQDPGSFESETMSEQQVKDADDLYEEAKAYATQLQSINTSKLENTMTHMMALGDDEYTSRCQSWLYAAIAKEVAQSSSQNKKGDSHRTVVCNTVKELIKSTQNYTSGSLSIITKRIDVQVDAPILRSGLVITDSPGIRDVDLAGNRETRITVNTGTIRLICATRARVESAEWFNTEVLRSIKAVGRKNTYVILTQIDLLTNGRPTSAWLTTCQQDPFKSLGELFANNESEICRISAIQRENGSGDLPNGMEDLELATADATDLPDLLEEELEFRESYKAYLRDIAKVALISHDCGGIRRALNKKFGSATDADQINVFFTSAGHYDQSLEARKLATRPLLFGTASGVPELRSHLIGLTGQGLLESLQRHAEIDLTIWYKNLERIYVKNGAQTDMDQLEAIHATTYGEWQQNIKASLTQCLKDGLNDIEANFIGPAAEHQKISNLLKATADDWRQGKSLHHQTFALICRRGGVVIRKTRGKAELQHHDWIKPVNAIFEERNTHWTMSSTALIDRTASTMLSQLDQHDASVKKKIPTLAMHLRNRRNAEGDWKGIKMRTKRMIDEFSTTAKAEINRIYDRLTDVQGKAPSAAVAVKMKPILNQVDQLFFETNQRTRRLVIKPAPGSTSKLGHYDRMSEYVSGELSDIKFVKGVALFWKNRTKEALTALVNAFTVDMANVSSDWLELIQIMRPINQPLSPDAEAVREQLKGDIGKIRATVNEIGRGVLLEEPLAPEDLSA